MITAEQNPDTLLYELKLTQDEAIWLRDFIDSRKGKQEVPLFTAMRFNIWNALYKLNLGEKI